MAQVRTDFPLRLEHKLVMMALAIALYSLQRDRGLYYILLVVFQRSQMYEKVHDFAQSLLS